jgi:hypothetical protein
MPKFIVLAGLSGVGKTYRRTTDPALKDLPYVDIADIYRDNPGGIPPRDAFSMLINEAFGYINDGAEAVVLEAYFKPGSFQRKSLEYYAEGSSVQVEYIDLTASVAVCKERILAQGKAAIDKGEDAVWWNNYTMTRIHFLAGSYSSS